LNTTGITSSAATLNWTAVSGAAGYNIQYRVVGAPTWTSTTSTSISTTLSSLTILTNYEWQVQTNCGSSNLSAFSASATFSTPLPPCNIPSGLNTTGITTTDATLNWTAVSGAVGYNIQYKEVSAPTWDLISSPTTSLAITSLNVLANYEWQVQTDCGGSNLSAFSASSTFSTISVPCNAPAGLSTTNISTTDATLTWTAEANAVSYRIQYRVVGAPSWTTQISNFTSVVLSSLTPFSVYEWKVQSDCGVSNFSVFSATATFVADPSVFPVSVFPGTWMGVDQASNHVTLTLTSTWICSMEINGVPVHSNSNNSNIVGFRLPQYYTSSASGGPAGAEKVIKFYTQNAIEGIMAPAPSNTSAMASNSLVTGQVQQTFTGLAVVSLNASGQYELRLYMDFNNFTSVPAVEHTVAPDGNPVTPDFTLIRQ
jgi:hypothetical protein